MNAWLAILLGLWLSGCCPSGQVRVYYESTGFTCEATTLCETNADCATTNEVCDQYDYRCVRGEWAE